MITAEPIIVLVRLSTVLVDVSVPVSFEDLRTSIRFYFYYSLMNLVFLIACIYASVLTSYSGIFMAMLKYMDHSLFFIN